jgi:hypothetical protein
MNKSVALVTPSYRNDFDRCALLCESIDRHVAGHASHYVIVQDDDLPLFQRFNKGSRIVLPSSRLLPGWLRPAPLFVVKNGRRVWWSFRAGIVHGWHIQQILKIAAASQLPEHRYCFADSDNVFFRDFDVSAYAGGAKTPLYVEPGAIAENSPMHGVWTRNCDRLLGQMATPFPADDFIGNQIVWDQSSVRAMTRAIEAASGAYWQAALCRTRAFSEYLLYGHFVRGAPAHLATHDITHRSLALAHWEFVPMTEGALMAMVEGAPADAVALCIGSFSNTPLRLVRDAVRKPSRTIGSEPAEGAMQFAGAAR